MNQTIWTGDNLEVMRGMADECINLIYLDPPFNSNQDYAAPIGSEAAGAEFKDTWTLPLYIDFGYDFECKRCNKCGEYLSTLESFEEHILMFHFKEAICLKDF